MENTELSAKAVFSHLVMEKATEYKDDLSKLDKHEMHMVADMFIEGSEDGEGEKRTTSLIVVGNITESDKMALVDKFIGQMQLGPMERLLLSLKLATPE